MQWIAIFAALVWTALQFGVFLFSLNCGFACINYEKGKKGRGWHVAFEIFGKLMISSYFVLLAIPFISIGLFWYGIINLTEWNEVKPAVWAFAWWWGVLLLFFAFRSGLDFTLDKQPGWGNSLNDTQQE